MQYIKSPLNYIGGKYKLLPQILPLFPKNINTFYDLFCGGTNVSINVEAKTIVANDISKPVIDFLRYARANDTLEMVNEIEQYIEKYSLSKTNRDGYLQLRDYYNIEDKHPIIFYTLLCYSFNNSIRFNSEGNYNVGFGMNRSFNNKLKEKFIIFAEHLKKKYIVYTDASYLDYINTAYHKDDFIYFDPPYSGTITPYMETYNLGWGEKNDLELFAFADTLNSKNIKFAISNIYKTDCLVEWSKKYNVHKLNYNYSNCNYNKKDKTGSEQEVLITNY
jgi:DNA adenine methylase Dam